MFCVAEYKRIAEHNPCVLNVTLTHFAFWVLSLFAHALCLVSCFWYVFTAVLQRCLQAWNTYYIVLGHFQFSWGLRHFLKLSHISNGILKKDQKKLDCFQKNWLVCAGPRSKWRASILNRLLIFHSKPKNNNLSRSWHHPTVIACVFTM